MKILISGDMMGGAGRTAFARAVSTLKSSGKVDFVIANAENAAAGKGITGKLAEEIFAAGADIITLGDHTWDQKDLPKFIERESRLIRPANFPPGCPGKGFVTVDTPAGRVTAISLLGRVFMRHHEDCPFRTADAILQKEPNLGKIIIVDIHAEATSEKSALARYLDGRVTAVIGTHTHVQTSDERILKRGTAFISDAGLTGPADSIIGCEAEQVLKVFLTGMRERFEAANTVESAQLEGAIVDVDESTGKARSIKRVRL